MRKLKTTRNSSQSARNVETICFCTMGLTNLISGGVTGWTASTRDMLGEQVDKTSRLRLHQQFSMRVNVPDNHSLTPKRRTNGASLC